jgi:hypothetical protein
MNAIPFTSCIVSVTPHSSQLAMMLLASGHNVAVSLHNIDNMIFQCRIVGLDIQKGEPVLSFVKRLINMKIPIHFEYRLVDKGNGDFQPFVRPVKP